MWLWAATYERCLCLPAGQEFHLEIFKHRRHARNVDQPFAALFKDLKSRGLFEETLVFCATEFDHNPFGFTIWLAGGGVKGGTVYGATDDFGFKAVENPVHVHDLHTTILYLLGIDHEKLTYRYSGPRLPAHRRARESHPRHHRLKSGCHPELLARGCPN